MIRIASHSYGIKNITLETERGTTPVMCAAEVEFKMILAATILRIPLKLDKPNLILFILNKHIFFSLN